ncbi:Gfo/Idh/MocA family protein [Paenibacillus sp. FSL R7-0128]|uniref:Gfo/Idh/MocA family protein n=1 Tax=Paenibacillus sp. FSL R7-0128 TaxID=2954529 RepID=UPI0030F9702D
MNHSKKIKVGIVGGSVNPESWAIKSHIPVLKNNEQYDLMAVSTSNPASAKQAKEVLDIKYAYDHYQELVQNPEIDLVVVSVKAPWHYEILKEAIKHHKHVYSEWPLTNHIRQSQELTMLAQNAKVHNIIGLQARQSSVLKQAKSIINQGRLGRILSAHMQVTTQGKGNTATNRTEYQFNPESGATLLDINGGHSLDLMTTLLGEFTPLAAVAQSSFGQIRNIETHQNIRQGAPSSWEVIGLINNSISSNVSIHGGALPGFTLLIRGEAGSLRLTQDASMGHPQFGNLVLEECLHPDLQLIKSSSGYSFEIIGRDTGAASLQSYFESIYHTLAGDIHNGLDSLPDFEAGYNIQLLINKIKELSVR